MEEDYFSVDIFRFYDIMKRKKKMRYLKQLFIILSISFVGELLNRFVPIPVPASIYGMGIMLLLLGTKILKVESVRDTAKYLIEIMPCMFIPAGVGLMTKWATLQAFLIPITVVIVVTTVIVMAVTGKAAQAIIRLEEKRDGESEEVENA